MVGWAVRDHERQFAIDGDYKERLTPFKRALVFCFFSFFELYLLPNS